MEINFDIRPDGRNGIRWQVNAYAPSGRIYQQWGWTRTKWGARRRIRWATKLLLSGL